MINFQTESSLDSSRPGTFVPLQEDRQTCRYIEYMGDPELQPIRSNECAFLVRNFYKLCCYINLKVLYICICNVQSIVVRQSNNSRFAVST